MEGMKKKHDFDYIAQGGRETSSVFPCFVPGFARQFIGASRPDHSIEKTKTNFCDFHLQMLTKARNVNSSIIC